MLEPAEVGDISSRSDQLHGRAGTARSAVLLVSQRCISSPDKETMGEKKLKKKNEGKMRLV